MKFKAPCILLAAVVCAWPIIALRPKDDPPPASPVPAPPALDAEVAAPRAPALLRHAAESAPSDIEMLIVAKDLAKTRQAEACAALLSIIDGLDLFSTSRSAWASLAKHLGMSPEEAFDEFFGEHAVFMSRDEGAPGQSWALTSRVSIASAKRLGASLGATPRSELGGLPVFALENGAFVLHIRSEKRTGGAWITIGPGGHPELFRSLVLPPKGTASLAADPKFNQLITSLPEAGDAFIFRRIAPGEPDFAVGAVRIAGASLVTSYAAHLTEMGAPKSGWSRESFDALADRTLLTSVESGRNSTGRILASAGGSVLGPIKALMSFFGPFEHDELLGDRRVTTIRRVGGSSIGIAFGVETPDTEQLAPLADDYMAAQLAPLFPKRINAKDRLSTAGLVPEAMRVVSMRGTGVAGLFRDPDHAAVAWSYADANEPDERHTGWWVAGIGPEAIDRTARSLAGEKEKDGGDRADGLDRGGEWSVLLSARPAELMVLIDSALELPISISVSQAMRRIDRVTLSERRLGAGRVVGSAGVDFIPLPQDPLEKPAP